jgi:hypothetical protein
MILEGSSLVKALPTKSAFDRFDRFSNFYFVGTFMYLTNRRWKFDRLNSFSNFDFVGKFMYLTNRTWKNSCAKSTLEEFWVSFPFMSLEGKLLEKALLTICAFETVDNVDTGTFMRSTVRT